jgi:predicted esterase
VIVRTIQTGTHGRYLLDPAAGEAVGLLVGFHGQSETAQIELEHLREIRGPRAWTLLSVQGLHRYYTRRGDVVAAWMTREDRDLAIADNIAYVRAVLEQVSDQPRPRRVVCCGFSQGTAMAYRTAAFSGWPVDGLVILAGDLPPDVTPHASRLPPVLIGRGSQEEWYTAEKAATDIQQLRAAGVRVEEHVFDAGHVRHPSFTERAGLFLDELVAATP